MVRATSILSETTRTPGWWRNRHSTVLHRRIQGDKWQHLPPPPSTLGAPINGHGSPEISLPQDNSIDAPTQGLGAHLIGFPNPEVHPQMGGAGPAHAALSRLTWYRKSAEGTPTAPVGPPGSAGLRESQNGPRHKRPTPSDVSSCWNARYLPIHSG